MNSKLNERSVRHTAVPRAQVYPFVILALAFLFAACTDYQAEFDDAFSGLEYADDVDYSSLSGGDNPLPSSSDGNNLSSSSVPTSSGDIQSSSSGVDEPLSSFVPASSEGKRSSSSEIVVYSSSENATSSSSSQVFQSSSSETSSSSFDYSSSGYFTDPRSDDNSTSRDYRYVRYNGLVWMDEDLNYRTDQMEMGNSSHPLYSWKSAQKACPEDWRLPTIEEFNNSQGLEYKIGIWEKLVGYFLMTEGHKAVNEGMYWTQSSKDDTVYAIQFSNNRDYGSVIGVDKKVLEENSVAATFAVRCVTESLTEESPRSSSSSVFISRETYLQDTIPYATVTIGGVKWMAQNLNYYGGTLQKPEHIMRCRNKTIDQAPCDSNGVYYDYGSAFDIASMDAGYKDDQYQAWTLPDSTQAAALLEAVGNGAGRLWSVEMYGTNESGFYALPSGYFSTSDKVNYNHEGNGETCFWLWSGNNDSETAKALCFYPKHNAGHEYGIESRPKTQLFPIRLIYASLHD